MYRLKLIVLIITNFRNLFSRFFSLIMKKKAKPSITVVTNQNDLKGKHYFDVHPTLTVNVNNGLILKVNKTYIPIRRNELRLQLNLVDFSSPTIEFKLIGALQRFKLSFPIQARNQVGVKNTRFNRKSLFEDLLIDSMNATNLRTFDNIIALDTSKIVLKSDLSDVGLKQPALMTPQVGINLELNEIKKELILNTKHNP